MTIYKMKIGMEPFNKIMTGKKIIESRLYDKKRRQIKVGDYIQFSQNQYENKTFLVIVKSLHIYPTFNNLFSDFPLLFFGRKSKKSLLAEIHSFYYFQEEKRYGVVGIKIKKIKPGRR